MQLKILSIRVCLCCAASSLCTVYPLRKLISSKSLCLSPVTYFGPAQSPQIHRDKKCSASSAKSLCLQIPLRNTHILNPCTQCSTVLWSDVFTAELHSDSCFSFFAVGERCDGSFKSMPVPPSVFLDNLASGRGSVWKPHAGYLQLVKQYGHYPMAQTHADTSFTECIHSWKALMTPSA